MKNARITFGSVVFVCLNFSCSVPNPGPGEALSDKTIPTVPSLKGRPGTLLQQEYDDPRNLMLDMYFPASGTTPKGIAIYAHGGGWNDYACSGTPPMREDIHAAARRLPDLGWILVSVQYRSAGVKDTDPPLGVVEPDNAFPTQIYDIKRAIRYAKWKVTQSPYNYDLGSFKFVGIGHSAGAQLMSIVGATAAKGTLEPPPGELPGTLAAQSSQLHAVIDIAGPQDMESWVTKNHARLKLANLPISNPIASPYCTDSTTLDAISQYLGCSLKDSSYGGNAAFPPCCTGSASPACFNNDQLAPVFHTNVTQASLQTHLTTASPMPPYPAFYVAYATEDGLVPAGGPHIANGTLGTPSAACQPAISYMNTLNRKQDFWIDFVEGAVDQNPDNNPFTDWFTAHHVSGLNATYLDGFLSRVVEHGNTLPLEGSFSDEERICGYPDNESVRISEISSTEDWVELVNQALTPIDLGLSVPGIMDPMRLTDNDPTHVYTFLPNTVLPAGGRLVVSKGSHFTFELDGADSLVLRQGAAAVLDQYSWSSPIHTHGRCPGSNDFVAMTPPTKNAANCPPDGG